MRYTGDDKIILTISDITNYINNTMSSSFLTVTLSPKLYKFSNFLQFEMTHNILYSILNKYCSHYVCVVEHTKQGNIHYHCILTTTNFKKTILLANDIKKNKLFGFIKLDGKGIINILKCATYLVKDIEFTSTVFNSHRKNAPIVMTKELWEEQISYLNV